MQSWRRQRREGDVESKRSGPPVEVDYSRDGIVSRSSDSRYLDIGAFQQTIVAQTTVAAEANALKKKASKTAQNARKGKSKAKDARWSGIIACVKKHLAAN